ncbi:homodimeric glycerol 3-phosphate dehydrogenase (quinone) [Roseovarius halotolerans]|uniref:Glycerol-3-phosphate dehydrogenase n=1 Tax=Roseovarius halotolerans TaxID=505353 RepID=A0A1X6Y927_9RHOB|nr:homodimeric glycerol 3-phosphate dehydrogenase (quinone) [Roseovarius halotolerans]SLN12472.1 Aerobic glycerol-3-phosphate dehydrogenase [Roseovarius halotolerans]
MGTKGQQVEDARGKDPVDLFVIGGGINGCGIARDAAGRGLSVELAEMNDLASATSSASTKLFHGGLRYLEYFEFRLVREALIERETLLRAMPHISWPMRFVLPLHEGMRFEGETPASKLLNRVMPWMKGRRPAWMIRLGLFIYDHLGGRKILPGTRAVDLTADRAGVALKGKFKRAFEYSDCWIEDSRLVVLNARDAEARGAVIRTRVKVVSARREGGVWAITLEDGETSARTTTRARALINAAGPWVGEVIEAALGRDASAGQGVRLVRGSHIVTRRLFDHDRSYFFQGSDGRIIFAIPYERDFTLIGTTDAEHEDPETPPVCTPQEADYLCRFASEYFAHPVTREDIVWSYSGVRPLYDDGAASATAATRDYVLKLEQRDDGAPLLNVFGGKITTYRKLAESAMGKLAPFFEGLQGDWTAGVALPGGDFAVDAVARLTADLCAAYPFLDEAWAGRLIRAYGTEAQAMLGDAGAAGDLGRDFGATLSEREVDWLMRREYARSAEDVLWRRSKLGLRMKAGEIAALDAWMAERRASRHNEPAATGGET